MGKVAEVVTEIVTPIAESCGLDIVEVTFGKRSDGMNLTIYIDKIGGVTIDDCERFHNAIDAPLDEADPIEGSYILNVSSPGLDRPLTLPKDFARNNGKKISVKLYKPLNGKKIYIGVLTEYDGERFSVVDGEAKYVFEVKDAAKIEPVIEF